MNDVVIVAGARTAIGTFGGSLKDQPPTALAAAVTREAVRRADVAPDRIGHVVFGNVIHTEPRDMYLARVGAIEAGIPDDVPALTLNRLCGSGLQSVVSAAQSIMLGDTDVALAGGAEVMSRGPHSTIVARFGQKMGDVTVHDMMLGALNDPFGNGHMGITAENVGERHQIDRATQDAFALESQRRAARAIEEGRFADQILPVEVRKGRETIAFDTDENPRAGTTAEDLARLKPVFRPDGTVTAGNASSINDGAGAVVLMNAETAAREGRPVLGRILGYAHAGVDPAYMGIGPVPAVTKLLDKLGLTPNDFDVIESNEAFAAQACAVARALGFPEDRTNPNGGAIALGHPVGATGTIILVKALYELARIGGKRALCTMCIGGGQGIALAVEQA